MNKFKILVLTAIVSVSGAANAGSHKHDGDMHHKHGPAMKVEKMAEKLSLTEKQKSEILGLMEAQHAQMKKMREAMRESRKQTHEQIEQILNDEQRAQFQAMHDKKHKKMKGKKHGENDHHERYEHCDDD
ncbi:hypothetical protein A3742_08885 [Oleiphilus sp. HI0071]|uniref:Spy/CpxP family protein refolding chaperone n=1 Tax=unclassified Oleiphilus TaxID=2631174 RepID=UPI0007C2BBEA|nr:MULTISPECIES: Spy/CpxP family protein refolding chaperone [unclassified Oleiphilus]KZY68918.1 hypothetical protein A3737_12580 [Oleiphilus sp. HI0065]KZY81326.1 hypothetical protein A3742_19800 [Oleiphilus sp. HI0071]KZY90054.1 hypothetical protein A3744_22005 [Oleiphilus sp. HI0073]KZZ44545.1 hypothetical protein A3758_14745 [Oleiphilus sp. HI0118]KZZ52092.1 hypothetical protein A3760_18520 [Oleiphilus sp. HI0122]KZZ64075.1 hypothetical protein A3765_07340 [Oleiphilus sp. HI0130]KZZ75714